MRTILFFVQRLNNTFLMIYVFFHYYGVPIVGVIGTKQNIKITTVLKCTIYSKIKR